MKEKYYKIGETTTEGLVCVESKNGCSSKCGYWKYPYACCRVVCDPEGRPDGKVVIFVKPEEKE